MNFDPASTREELIYQLTLIYGLAAVDALLVSQNSDAPVTDITEAPIGQSASRRTVSDADHTRPSS